MRVLVTGGAGLIGSHLVDELLAHGHEVTVLDNLDPVVHPRGKPGWVPREVRFLEGDVRDPRAVDRALEGCEGVFHLAACGGFGPDLARTTDVNCTGTARLFEAIRRGGTVGRVIVASSMAIYGEGWYRCAEHGAFHGTLRSVAAREAGRWEVTCPRCGAECAPSPIPETSPLRPHGAYASSKLLQERMTLALALEDGLHAVALRYFLTFGPRQSDHNAYSGLASIFSNRLRSGRAPVLYEDGRQTRDLVSARDVARANRLVLEDERAAGRAFNVASGRSTRILDFARLLAAAHGIDIEPTVPQRFRPLDPRHVLGDASALRALGWEVEEPLEACVERAVRWFREEGPPVDGSARQDEELARLGVVRQARVPGTRAHLGEDT